MIHCRREKQLKILSQTTREHKSETITCSVLLFSLKRTVIECTLVA